MAVQKISNALLYGLSTDTKPTTYADNTLFVETDTGNIYQSQTGVWSLYIGAAKTETLTNKAIDADGAGNSITNIDDANIKAAAAISVSKLAAGTDTHILKTVSGVPTWAAEAAGGTSVIPFAFIIYMDVSTAKAFNTNTGNIDYSSTDHCSVFNSVITDMNAIGGGTALVKPGTYTNNATVKNIIPKNNVGLVGEDRQSVILKNTLNTADSTMFRYWNGASSSPLSRFSLKNLTVTCNDGAQTDSCWLSSGTEYLRITDCHFKSFQDPSTAKILFFIDTAGNTNTNDYAFIQRNTFEGNTTGQDMLGCGDLNYSDVSHNLFLNGNGQAIGAANIEHSNFINNIFLHCGSNIIGFEAITQFTNVTDNISIDSGKIKLSQNGNQTTHQFHGGICSNNLFIYGDGGIEAGYTVNSKIDDNMFYRTRRVGVEGTFNRCSISNNLFIETNYNWNNSNVIGAGDGRPGGIELMNNTSWTGQANNMIHDNMFYRTAASFTVPTGYIYEGGQSKSGLPGGVMIQSNFTNTYIYDNLFDGLESGKPIIDGGTGTSVRDNNGYISNTDSATLTGNQTLTNKTMDASSNSFTEIAQSPITKRWGQYQPHTPTSASAISVGNLTGILVQHTPTGPGTNTNTFDTTEGLLANLKTTTTINQNAGLVSPTGALGVGRRLFGMKAILRSSVDTVAGGVSRLHFGFTSATALPISDTPIANADSGIIVGFISTDTNYSIRHNDGTGAATVTAVTGPIAKNTSFHTIEIQWTASGNIVVTFDGTAQTISTDLPLTTDDLKFHCTAQNATGAIRTHAIKGVWLEADK